MITPAQAQPDTLLLYAYLPQFVQANDAEGGYQFLTWLDAFISEGSDLSSLTYNYSYANGIITPLAQPVVVNNNPVPTGAGIQAVDEIIRDTPFAPGYSILLDVNRCPTYALPWLAQFVGVRFLQPESDAVMREEIQFQCASFRGTVSHITYVANAQMLPGYTITIQERTSFINNVIGYDPYALTIMFPLEGVGSLTYGELFADYIDYAAVQSAYATYGAMSGYIANLETAVLAAIPAGISTYFNPF